MKARDGEPTTPIAPPAPLRALDLGPFVAPIEALTPERRAQLDPLVIEATFADLQAAMADGRLTSVELATHYLARIGELDGRLRSMTELNPDALIIAARLDQERAEGRVRGPLHGIPISLKDNIGTGDRLHTTAGAAAMETARSDRDACVAARLRAAGAVFLGKASMSEWAGWMLQDQPGYSALGGQAVNPLDATLPVFGSSSGSAVGTCANLVAASIGTETMGSIIAPASINGVVGIHPSIGLVSRDRIIPLTDQTDTAGPIARTVTDAAILLTAIAGTDPSDPMTASAAALEGTDFATFLDPDALTGRRVGLFTDVSDGLAAQADGQAALADAIPGLEAAGAVVVPVWMAPLDNMAGLLELIHNGFRLGFADHMAATDPGYPIRSVADVVAFNAQDPARYAPFGQEVLVETAGSGLDRSEHEALGASLRAEARAYLDSMLRDHGLDAVVAPAQLLGPAYAVAGYPAITVPMSPGVGLTFTGGHLTDGAVIGMAYAYEQATRVRAAPPDGR